MDTTTCVHTAKHDRHDRLTIAALSGTIQRLAYPLYREDPNYNEAAAVAELHGFTTDPHLLAHATGSTRGFLHQATRSLLLAAGASQTDLDAIAAHIDQHSPMPH